MGYAVTGRESVPAGYRERAGKHVLFRFAWVRIRLPSESASFTMIVNDARSGPVLCSQSIIRARRNQVMFVPSVSTMKVAR